MTHDGILILSHCGYSFVEDLVAVLRERGLQAWVLSSRPLPEQAEQRLQALRGLVDALFATETHELQRDDVESAIAALSQRGGRVLACITVWEGYRALMAHANGLLGVPDLQPEQVDALRDKLSVRNRLHVAGLSRASAQALTPTLLARLQREGRPCFIKPVHGIASYGAFRLSAETRWAALEQISQRIRQDTVYISAMGDGESFLVEDYIAGTEFSFEVLVSAGQAFVVAVHEKCQLTEQDGTVLEDSCTSPPATIASEHVAAGLRWVAALLKQLGLAHGCFHIEARFDGQRWDLIEINPRVGGSLISPSVKAMNGQAGLLALWMGLLLDGVAMGPLLQRLSYAADGTPPTDRATFFRVYFASPGRIESIHQRTHAREPVVCQVLLKPGDEIAPSSREVFLGQLLWQMSRDERDAELGTLLRTSTDAIDVRYAQPESADAAAAALGVQP